MSIAAIEAAIASWAPSHTAKLVMLVLAHHHNATTGRCFPSQERIAAEASLAKSSVVRALKELVDHSLITKVKGQRAGRKNAPNFYKLVFLTQPSLQEKQRHAGYARDGRAALPEQGTPTSPLRSEVGSAKPKKRTQRKAPRRRMEPGWKPSKAQIAQATEMGFSEQEIARMTIDFVEYYIGNGETAANWGMHFSRWMRRQADRKEADHERQARTQSGAGAGGRGDERQDALRRIFTSTAEGGGGSE